MAILVGIGDCRVETASAALRVEFVHRTGFTGWAVDGGDLVARHGGVEVIEHRNDERGEDEDQSECDDGAEVEHGSEHPGAVLVDLEAFDVVVCEADAGGCENHKHSDSCLGVECAAEGSSGDHEGSDVADEDEEDDGVAVDAVEDEEFVADDGDELPDHQEAGG